jgi:peptidyl-prolyl cis-trans isomerase SurA
MRKRTTILIACFLAFALAQAFAGTVIDRIVATVNGHIILQSEWEDEVHYEAFMAGRRPDQVTTPERKAALDRLIDQELLREQMTPADSFRASDADVEKRLQEVRSQYGPAGTDTAWQVGLRQYGLTEAEIKKRIGDQLDLMHFVDTRLRPNVQVDEKSIESYYNQELLPQLRQSGSQSVALATVTPKIKELLTQRKVNELLVSWLRNLRSESNIHSDQSPTAGERSP